MSLPQQPCPPHHAPTGLLCDLLAQPHLGRVITTQPTFGWMVNGGQPGAAQKAYQIRVRTQTQQDATIAIVHTASDTASPSNTVSPSDTVSPFDFAADTPSGLMWDSGQVASGQSLNIPYAGKPLQLATTYQWAVRTWPEGADEPGPWSATQSFTPLPATAEETATGENTGQTGCTADSPYPPEVSFQYLQTVAIAPDRIEARGATDFIDFGKQAFGWLEVEIACTTDASQMDTSQVDAPQTSVSQTASRQAVIRLGEALKGDAIDREPPGSVRYAQTTLALRPGTHRYRVQTPADERNTSGAAIRLPVRLGVVLPFRYAEIELPQGAHLIAATLVRIQYPFDEKAASFQSDSEELNRLWSLCHYTMLATSFAGYYVDGDRERIPYEADAYINQLGHYATDREYSLARRTHEYLLRHPTWPTEWKQHSVLIAWADYEATGDDRSLRRHYDLLKSAKCLSRYARADGLLSTGHFARIDPQRNDCGDLVDWPPAERDQFEMCDVNTVINAFHYRTLVLMARIAATLGHTADATAFDTEAEQVRTRFNQILFDAQRGCYVDGEGSSHTSQHASLFALAFGLVPQEHIAQVVAFVKSRRIACSVYAAQYLLEGLFLAREADFAIALMNDNDDLRSWRTMLRQDATLTWEAWDQSLKPNQDWNHAWGAAPANILSRYVLGVQPLEPGYGHVLIDPQPGRLQHVEGTVPTIRGPIRIHVRKNGDTLHCRVQAPAGVRLSYAQGLVVEG